MNPTTEVLVCLACTAYLVNWLLYLIFGDGDDD